MFPELKAIDVARMALKVSDLPHDRSFDRELMVSDILFQCRNLGNEYLRGRIGNGYSEDFEGLSYTVDCYLDDSALRHRTRARIWVEGSEFIADLHFTAVEVSHAAA